MLNGMIGNDRGVLQKGMTQYARDHAIRVVQKEKRGHLFRIQLQGAFVRTAGMGVIGFFTLVAFLHGAIAYEPFRCAVIVIALIVLMQFPFLLILKRVSNRVVYDIISLSINVMEILGYTAFIYFAGGFRATYLTPIYAGMIFYVGVLAPKRYPFIMAACASISFVAMVTLEHFGFLPHQKILFEYNFEWNVLFLILVIICALLFVVAFMSSYTSGIIQEARARQKKQNIELERANERLLQEIEERNRAYKALRESEEKLHDIFENVSDGLFSHDLNGVFLETNLGMKRLLGYYLEEEELPKGLSLAAVTPERYRDTLAGYLEDILKKGKGEGISYLLTKQGTECIVEYKNSLIRDVAGNPVGIRGSIRDVTEKQQAEKEKQKLQEQLQQAKKMEALGTLAGGVAHDLNNILSGIVSYPELLLMDIPEDNPLRRPLLTIQKSGVKAASIVQDLLTLARRGVAVSEMIDLNSCIRDYLKSPEYHKLLSLYPGIELTADLPESLDRVCGSSVHLAKTIMNLVTNAAESIRDGGRITIQSAKTYLEFPMKGFESFHRGEYIVLKVSDTGVGMSDEDRERIFDPFYTRKAMGRSGTGLGLTVVWGTVKDMGGHIDVQSTSGQGSAFTIYFPAHPEGMSNDEAQKQNSDFAGNGESILVVDDSEEQREIASRMLSKLGYSVIPVPSGESAVEYLQTNTVDLVLLDMIMNPGIDGLETYKRILALHPKQKAVIASGYSETERVKEAQRLGAGSYIRKPYLMEQIGLAIFRELKKNGR